MNHDLRRSLRLRDYDYSQGGAYFLTLCSAGRERLFGNVVGDYVALSYMGRIIQEEWLRSSKVRSEIILDEFVIMPNHFHGIVFISFGDQLPPPGLPKAHYRAPLQRPKKSLGSLVAQFKAVVTTRVRKELHLLTQPVWQRNYYDHIIRSPHELDQIRKYIQENPLKWHLDEYCHGD